VIAAEEEEVKEGTVVKTINTNEKGQWAEGEEGPKTKQGEKRETRRTRKRVGGPWGQNDKISSNRDPPFVKGGRKHLHASRPCP